MKYPATPRTPARQQGMTLVELLVAMVIGLVVILAVTRVVTLGESQRRTTTAGNDTSQSGAFAAYAIDRAVRSAGSGFAQAWQLGVFGCRLSATRVINAAPTVILPRVAAFPVPFQNFLGGAGAANAGNLRLAPLLIARGQAASGSDVLAVMGGNAAAGDVPRLIRSGIPLTNDLRLDTTVGLAHGDIGLVAQDGVADCLVEQVNVTDAAAFAAPGNQTLPLGGTYFTATGSTTSLATLAASGSAYFSALGTIGAANPQFSLLGVGANRTLFAYDLLRQAGTGTEAETPPVPLADGVAELHAIYGRDTNNDGVLDSWTAPDAAGFDIATLMATPASQRQIVAVRVALVMRGSLYEKDVVTPPSLTVFADLPVAQRRILNLTVDDQHYRYRVIDTTIPLRNLLLPTT